MNGDGHGYRISSALAELINICNAAKWHKANCRDEDCGVALYQLGMTANRLVNSCWLSERDKARRIIHETNWT